jgi:hypothetical protein
MNRNTIQLGEREIREDEIQKKLLKFRSKGSVEYAKGYIAAHDELRRGWRKYIVGNLEMREAAVRYIAECRIEDSQSILKEYGKKKSEKNR